MGFIIQPLIEEPPLNIRNNNYSFDKLYELDSCNVSVIWMVYDRRRKVIVNMGLSRPCGVNHRKASIHAEQKAIEYCRGKSRNYDIYIWRYSKGGKIKEKYCCTACTKLAQKYNFTNKIYTFVNGTRCSAVIDKPPLSLCYQIRD
tara:strand:+ start:183 stop:617 length:435 start_codon:yes stop_codon:yes gene_type:complete